MLPQNLYIIRHGESAANLDHGLRATLPDHLVPLSSLGEQQCLELGQHLGSHLSTNCTIWTSPYARARATTALFSQALHNFTVREDVRLREQEWGNFYSFEQLEGYRQMFERHSRFFYRIPDGESGADVFDRLCSFLEMLARENTAQTVLISTHGMTGMVLLMRLLGWSVEEYERCEWFVNCGYVQLEMQENKYTIVHDHRRGWQGFII
jgi:broad specificity phosphatase PhoE